MTSRTPCESGADLEWVSCGLCGADAGCTLLRAPDRLFGGETLFAVVQCGRCGFMYVNPRPDAAARTSFYPSGSYVPHQAGSGGSGRVRWLRRAARDRVLRLIYGYGAGASGLAASTGLAWSWGLLRSPPWRPGGRLLDVGSGNGQYMSDMHELGWDVSGVEPSPDACESVRKRLNLPVHLGTLEDALLDAESFDVVTAWHVLEHSPSPLRDLLEISRLLRPGGLFMGEVPNAAGWGARLFRDRWYHWDLPRHLVAFTPSTLRRLIEAAGFTTYRLLAVPDVQGWAGSLQYLRDRAQIPVGIRRVRWRRSANCALWPVAILAAAAGGPECMRVIVRQQ